MVLTDSNNIQWFVATGQQGITGQSRNEANDKRWSGNVSGVSTYGYEVTCYGTFSGTAGGGEAHFALKHWGPNHSGDCGHKESGSCCCWYDTGIRDTGEVQLQTERPHPSNHDFNLPGTQLFITDIGIGMEGKTIGLKWLVYPIIPGGTANNGGIRLKMWVDTSGFGSNGKPQNQWRLVYSFIDTGQILGNYEAPDEHDIENRVSDTDSVQFYAGGQHWRKLQAGDAARDDGNTTPPPPPPTGGTGNNIDPFGIKMIYPTKEGGQTWFQNDNPEFDGQLVSDLEIITKVGDYFLASEETDEPGGVRFLRVLTQWGDLGRISCDPNESNWSNFASQGHVFTQDDWTNVEITCLIYPQDLGTEGDPGSPTGNDFDWALEARGSFGEFEEQTGCCGIYRYAGTILCTNTGDAIGKVRFNKRTPAGANRTENFTHTVKNTFFRSWTGVKFIVYNIKGDNNEDWVQLELWLCPSDSSTDLATSWTKVATFIDKGNNWGSGGENCNGTDKQAYTWGSHYVGMRYNRMPELRWKKWSVREIDINGSFPPDDPGPGPGPGPGPDPCEEVQQQQQPLTTDTTIPTYKFLSWGDNDTTSNARAVLDRMFTETDVSQYLFAGDGPYSTNANSWIDMMSEYFSTPALKEKLMLAQGNHEHPESESQTAENQIEAWFPGLNNPIEGLEWLQAKKVGNAYIIVMNSQDPDIDEVGSIQYNWIANELQKAKTLRNNGQIDWIITMVHKSWFNLLGSNPAYVTARHAYAAIFLDAQVDFMFHGHNHSYAIWRPIIDIPGNDENTAAQQLFTLAADGRYDFTKQHGAFYIINGNGGHEINQWGENPANFPNIIYANDDDFGYTRLTIQGKQATIKAIKVDGTELFSVGVTRGTDPTPNPNPDPDPTPDPCEEPPPPPPPEAVYNDMIIVYNINSDSDGCICNAPPFNPPPPGEEPPPPPPTGGGGSGGENNAIYNIPFTGSGADDLKMASESGDDHFYLQVGTQIKGTGSPLYNKNIKRIEWPLRKRGNPKGTATVVIRKGSDNSIAKTLGTIDVEDLTTNTEYKGVENTSASYTTVVGDRILIEYDGGDDNDYIIAWAVDGISNDTKLTKRDNTMSAGNYRDRDQEASFRAFA